jgi:DNA-binding response OmpR family regulator
MPKQPLLQVLLIEDNPGDAELVKETLKDAGGFQVYWVQALLPGLDRAARGDIDLVLLDLHLPDSNGLEGLHSLRTHAPSLPVVVLTGFESESLALRSVESGAQEYVVKGSLQGPALARALLRAVARHKINAQSSRVESRQEEAKVLGFLGAKGGVGTTTVACHVGMELKRQTENRVLVMDLDLTCNTMAFLMNVNSVYGVTEVAYDFLHLDESSWAKFKAAGPGGLDIIQSGGPVFSEEKQPKAERVRLVLRFLRSLYQWIIVDLGRLNLLSARVAEDVDRLYMVGTCDLLGLNQARTAASALLQTGFQRDSLALIVNQAPQLSLSFNGEFEKFLGVPVEAVLPECRKEFEDSFQNGKRLGESRKFQSHIARLTAGITGVESVGKDNTQAPKAPRFAFLPGALRRATTGI